MLLWSLKHYEEVGVGHFRKVHWAYWMINLIAIQKTHWLKTPSLFTE